MLHIYNVIYESNEEIDKECKVCGKLNTKTHTLTNNVQLFLCICWECFWIKTYKAGCMGDPENIITFFLHDA